MADILIVKFNGLPLFSWGDGRFSNLKVDARSSLLEEAVKAAAKDNFQPYSEICKNQIRALKM